MTDQKTSCVHRGNTFFGTFSVLGHGAEGAVRVLYNGIRRDARLDGLPPDVVAHWVLRELVLRDVEASRPFAFGHRAGPA